MSKVVGVLRGRKIYEHELTLDMQCDVGFVAVTERPFVDTGMRCDYCGRTVGDGAECKSCGAPFA